MRSRRSGTGPRFPYLDADVDYPFPDPGEADPRGILCEGGNLSPGMLVSAYRRGIFPWFNEEDPILWWSPDPRFVLLPAELHVSATMRKLLRRRRFELALDRDFPAVILECSRAARPGQRGTWITSDMIEAYVELHRLGFAHSVEARLDGALVGGLYGVSLGSAFFGESMFSLEDDASKAAFIPLVWRLADEGFTLVDSQVYTDHMAGLGAREIPRTEYLRLLEESLAAPARSGDWGILFRDFPSSEAYRRIVMKETDAT